MSSMPKPFPRGLAWTPYITRPCSLARAVVVSVVLMCLWYSPAGPARAQQAETETHHNESTIKAVFLYSFGRYTKWPENTFKNASEPFVIGIVGEDSFGGELDELASKKTIHERKIVVRRFATPDEYKQPCHILFVSHSIPVDQQTALIKKTQGTAMLVVGETPGFVENGGGANFFTDGDRIRFEINVESARRSQLRMDAVLLNLGKPVGSQKTETSN